METQRHSRDQIIEAAYKILGEQGYAATTISAIAAEAKVARGLLHYYFKNKDEILVAVLQEAARRYTTFMQQVSQEVPAEELGRVSISDARARVSREPERYLLRFELFALALRNPVLQSGTAALFASGRDGIKAVVRQAVSGRVADPDALAAVILACFDGLALQQMLDPHFAVASAYDVLYDMLMAYARPD